MKKSYIKKIFEITGEKSESYKEVPLSLFEERFRDFCTTFDEIGMHISKDNTGFLLRYGIEHSGYAKLLFSCMHFEGESMIKELSEWIDRFISGINGRVITSIEFWSSNKEIIIIEFLFWNKKLYDILIA